MDENKLRQLASWDRQTDKLAEAQRAATEAKKLWQQANESVRELKNQIRDDCPLSSEFDTLEYRLWMRTNVIDDDTSCWEYMGARRPVPGENYGQISAGEIANLVGESDHKSVSSHRVSYILAYGEVPEVVRHTCDNPPCVRPSHLLNGTHQDNMNDRHERGRYARTPGPRGERSARTTLTDANVIEARQMAKKGMAHQEIADYFGVTRMNATLVIGGRSFSHLNDIEAPVKKPGGTKFTDDDIRTIRRRKAEGDTLAAIAQDYGVSASNISFIVSRKTFKHVTH